jgi:hypothetical protein
MCTSIVVSWSTSVIKVRVWDMAADAARAWNVRIIHSRPVVVGSVILLPMVDLQYIVTNENGIVQYHTAVCIWCMYCSSVALMQHQ